MFLRNSVNINARPRSQRVPANKPREKKTNNLLKFGEMTFYELGHFQKMYTHAKICISNGNFSCNGLNESLSDLWFRTLIINTPYIYFDKIKLHLSPILGVFVCVHCQKNTFQMIFFRFSDRLDICKRDFLRTLIIILTKNRSFFIIVCNRLSTN